MKTGLSIQKSHFRGMVRRRIIFEWEQRGQRHGVVSPYLEAFSNSADPQAIAAFLHKFADHIEDKCRDVERGRETVLEA